MGWPVSGWLRWVRRLFSMTGLSTATRRGFASGVSSGIGKMGSLKCPKCARRYPDTATLYATCIACNKPTQNDDRRPTSSDLQAQALFTKARKMRERHFEYAYSKHREKRRALGYPEPEDVGRMQGKREAEALRQLEALWEVSDDGEAQDNRSPDQAG
jgi:hypothetical protein